MNGYNDGLCSHALSYKHYENMPMHTEIFIGIKNENFQQEKKILIFAQNIDCGYMLELPRFIHVRTASPRRF